MGSLTIDTFYVLHVILIFCAVEATFEAWSDTNQSSNQSKVREVPSPNFELIRILRQQRYARLDDSRRTSNNSEISINICNESDSELFGDDQQPIVDFSHNVSCPDEQPKECALDLQCWICAFESNVRSIKLCASRLTARHSSWMDNKGRRMIRDNGPTFICLVIVVIIMMFTIAPWSL